MLIYNSKKEFIGIDEIDLNKLGFSNLSELQNEATDFADLFIKEPGFIHNFEHVNWIDFVECSDSLEGAKVLIQVNSRNFKCYLTVSTAFLTQDPSSKAYFVHLNNISELTDSQTEYISVELLQKSTPQPIKKKSVEKPIQKPTVDQPVEKTKKTEETIPTQIPQDTKKVEIKEVQTKKIEDVISLDLDIDDKKETKSKASSSKEKGVEKFEIFNNGYIYDPSVASSDLGLPVDLIEEFIEDFIGQANDFKSELYSSLNSGDYDNVKMLSHKLKGVAANLRIEDALESITIVNTSNNIGLVQEHLDTFYKIISKLSNEKIAVTDTKIFQEEEKTIKIDSEIEAPEIADDEFLSPVPQTEEADKKNETENETETIEMFTDDIFSAKEVDSKTDKESIALEVDEIEGFELDFKDETPSLDVQQTSTSYNKKLIASEIGLDEESFNELLEDYLLEAQKTCASISQAIEINDNENWVKQSHKLQGMSANMRITSFDEELNTLIHTTDQAIATDSNNKIIENLQEISDLEG